MNKIDEPTIDISIDWLEANIDLKEEMMASLRHLYEIAFCGKELNDYETEWVMNDIHDIDKQVRRVVRREKLILDKYKKNYKEVKWTNKQD